MFWICGKVAWTFDAAVQMPHQVVTTPALGASAARFQAFTHKFRFGTAQTPGLIRKPLGQISRQFQRDRLHPKTVLLNCYSGNTQLSDFRAGT
jgi:hypothetical protein